MKLKIELTFPGELKEEPIICNLAKNFNLIFNIIEASFSTEIGWALLILIGEEKELKRALDFLRQKGITIDNITPA